MTLSTSPVLAKYGDPKSGCPPLITTTIFCLGVEHSLVTEVAQLPHRLHLGDEPVGELVPPVEGNPSLAAHAEPLLEALWNVFHRHFVVGLWLGNVRVRIMTRVMI